MFKTKINFKKKSQLPLPIIFGLFLAVIAMVVILGIYLNQSNSAESTSQQIKHEKEIKTNIKSSELRCNDLCNEIKNEKDIENIIKFCSQMEYNDLNGDGDLEDSFSYGLWDYCESKIPCFVIKDDCYQENELIDGHFCRKLLGNPHFRKLDEFNKIANLQNGSLDLNGTGRCDLKTSTSLENEGPNWMIHYCFNKGIPYALEDCGVFINCSQACLDEGYPNEGQCIDDGRFCLAPLTDTYSCNVNQVCCCSFLKQFPCQTFNLSEVKVKREFAIRLDDSKHSTPIAADINNDNKVEVMFRNKPGNHKVFNFEAGVATELFEINLENHLNADFYSHPYAFCDLDADGLGEIIFATKTGIKILDHEGNEIRSFDDGQYHNMPSCADIDQDGISEIITTASIFDINLNKLYDFKYPITDNMIFPHPVRPRRYPHYRNMLKYAANNVPYDIIDKNGTEIITRDGIVFKNSTGDFELEFWPKNITCQTLGVAEFGEHYRPNGYEVICVNTTYYRSNPTIYLVDPENMVLLNSISFTYHGGGQPLIGDFDLDGLNDFGIIFKDHFFAINNDFSIMWHLRIDEDSSGVSAATLFDLNGDSIPEIIYRDHSNFYIVDSRNGDVVYQIGASSTTLLEYPIVLDIDQDNESEILYINDGSNELKVHGSGDESVWRSTRDIWNQYNFHYSNINDDLSIPQKIKGYGNNLFRATYLLNKGDSFSNSTLNCCGDGEWNYGEECEPGVLDCPSGKTCENCTCV